VNKCRQKSGNLGDTGISKIRRSRHPSGGPAGHAIAFETRHNLSQAQKGVGKTGGVGAFSRLGPEWKSETHVQEDKCVCEREARNLATTVFGYVVSPGRQMMEACELRFFLLIVAFLVARQRYPSAWSVAQELEHVNMMNVYTNTGVTDRERVRERAME